MNVRMIEWIKVEDKLPEDERLVLVYKSGTDSVTVSLFIFNGFSDPIEGCYFANITHWAYFPDPPNNINL